MKDYKYYEKAALEIYKSKGFKLLKNNHRGLGFEIDLILIKRKHIKIVEVKASTFEPDIIAQKFMDKQYRCYMRFLSKIEISHLSTYNLSFDIIIFAKNPYKVLEFNIYKIIE